MTRFTNSMRNVSLSVHLKRKITQVSQTSFLKKDLANKLKIPTKCILEQLICIQVKKELSNAAQIAWVSNSQLMMVLTQELFMINFKVGDLTPAQKGLKYGI